MRSNRKRLQRVAYAIDAAPVRAHLLREAYEWFRDFGELPDDDHVAYEVVQQALRGGEEAPPMEEATLAKQVRKAAIAYRERERPRDSWPPSVRALLFDEALFECPPLRKLARAAITTEVAWGGDVENRAFAARHGIPGYGSVAMHVCGYPGKLAVPPFEAEAKRLFVRMDSFRGRLVQDDPRWIDAQTKVLAAFLEAGELPDDELQLEGVLVTVGLDLLQAHRHGRDVRTALQLVDETARATGDEFQRCIEKLAELARTKRLWNVRTDAGCQGRPTQRTPPAP